MTTNTRLYPRGRAEHSASAQHLYAQMTDPEADPSFVAKAQELTGTSCPAYLSALEAHRKARAQTSMAQDAQDDADQARDKAGSDFFKAVHLNCDPEVYAELRSLLGGRPPNEVLKAPHKQQQFIEEVFFAQLEARTDLKVPADRLATWRERHEAMRLAVGAVSAASSTQRELSDAVDAAEETFGADYRTLIKHLLLLWSEDKTRATLLGFSTRSSKAKSVEAEQG